MVPVPIPPWHSDSNVLGIIPINPTNKQVGSLQRQVAFFYFGLPTLSPELVDSQKLFTYQSLQHFTRKTASNLLKMSSYILQKQNLAASKQTTYHKNPDIKQFITVLFFLPTDRLQF